MYDPTYQREKNRKVSNKSRAKNEGDPSVDLESMRKKKKKNKTVVVVKKSTAKKKTKVAKKKKKKKKMDKKKNSTKTKTAKKKKKSERRESKSIFIWPSVYPGVLSLLRVKKHRKRGEYLREVGKIWDDRTWRSMEEMKGGGVAAKIEEKKRKKKRDVDTHTNFSASRFRKSWPIRCLQCNEITRREDFDVCVCGNTFAVEHIFEQSIARAMVENDGKGYKMRRRGCDGSDNVRWIPDYLRKEETYVQVTRKSSSSSNNNTTRKSITNVVISDSTRLIGETLLAFAQDVCRRIKTLHGTKLRLIFPSKTFESCRRCECAHHPLLPCAYILPASAYFPSTTTSSSSSVAPNSDAIHSQNLDGDGDDNHTAVLHGSRYYGVEWVGSHAMFASILEIDGPCVGGSIDNGTSAAPSSNNGRKWRIFLGAFQSEFEAAFVHDFASCMHVGIKEARPLNIMDNATSMIVIHSSEDAVFQLFRSFKTARLTKTLSDDEARAEWSALGAKEKRLFEIASLRRDRAKQAIGNEVVPWVQCDRCERWHVALMSAAKSLHFQCSDVCETCDKTAKQGGNGVEEDVETCKDRSDDGETRRRSEAEEERTFGVDNVEARLLLLDNWTKHRFSKIVPIMERVVAWACLVSRDLDRVVDTCDDDHTKAEEGGEMRKEELNLYLLRWRDRAPEIFRDAVLNHLWHRRPAFLLAPVVVDTPTTTRAAWCVERRWWQAILRAAHDWLPPLEHLSMLSNLVSRVERRIASIDGCLERLDALDRTFLPSLHFAQSFASSMEQLTRTWSRESPNRSVDKLVTCGTWTRTTAFVLPGDDFPNYGGRLGLSFGNPFRASEGGMLLRRGVVKLTPEEAANLHQKGQSSEMCWLRGIFLAEPGKANQFVLEYNGAKRRVTQVRSGSAKRTSKRVKRASSSSSSLSTARRSFAKFRTHVLRCGNAFLDASDTDMYPCGLLNTNPNRSNSCKIKGRMVTLTKRSPKNTFLTIPYGKSYNTSNYIQFQCIPTSTSATFGASSRHLRAKVICICRRSSNESDMPTIRCANAMPKTEKQRRLREANRKRKSAEPKSGGGGGGAETTKSHSNAVPHSHPRARCTFCDQLDGDKSSVLVTCCDCESTRAHRHCVSAAYDENYGGKDEHLWWQCNKCVRRRRRRVPAKNVKNVGGVVVSRRNNYCDTELFHLSCVGLKRRTRGWLCEKCSRLNLSKSLLEGCGAGSSSTCGSSKTLSKRKKRTNPSGLGASAYATTHQLALDAKVEIYWPEEQRWFKGKVAKLDPEHGIQIAYNDGDQFWYPTSLENFAWRRF
eukprot:g2672.t1